MDALEYLSNISIWFMSSVIYSSVPCRSSHKARKDGGFPSEVQFLRECLDLTHRLVKFHCAEE